MQYFNLQSKLDVITNFDPAVDKIKIKKFSDGTTFSNIDVANSASANDLNGVSGGISTTISGDAVITNINISSSDASGGSAQTTTLTGKITNGIITFNQ